jgi:hypothetical protein
MGQKTALTQHPPGGGLGPFPQKPRAGVGKNSKKLAVILRTPGGYIQPGEKRAIRWGTN